MRAYAAKTFVKALAPYEKRFAKSIRKRGPTITVSGPSGSGKSTAAKAIAKRMRLKYVSAGEIFRRYAKERGIPLEKFSKMREKKIDYEMDVRTLKYAIRGGCVLDARLSGWVAGKWADCRVYVAGSSKVRAGRMAKREGVSKTAASEIMRARDREDNRKYKKLYGINLFDRKIYDIVVNNDRMSLRDARTKPVKIVKEFLRARKRKSRDD